MESKNIKKKNVIQEGEGEELPKNGNVVAINYRLLQNGKELDSTYPRDKVFEFELGKGQVVKGLENAVKKMKVKEKSVFEMPASEFFVEEKSKRLPLPSITSKKLIEVEIELVWCVEEKKDETSEWELTPKEKIEKCQRFKDEGNGVFKQKEYRKALKSYKKAIVLLESDFSSPIEENKEEINQRLRQLYLDSLLNAASSCFKIKQNEESVEYCSKALQLDKTLWKAYYKRGQTYLQMEEYALCIEDLKKGLEFVPEKLRKAVEQSLKKAKLKKKEFEKREKKKYSGMF